MGAHARAPRRLPRTFISASPAGLMPQRSATRIILSRCLPSSLGVASGSCSGKKMSQAALSLVMKLVMGLLSGRAVPGFIWYLIELPTAAAAEAGSGICICCGRAADRSLPSAAGRTAFARMVGALGRWGLAARCRAGGGMAP
jgi:hypothetical protein